MFGAGAARARGQAFSELTALVKAGISIGHALSDLGEDMGNNAMGRTLVRMGREVTSGTSLASAMRHQDGAFEPLIIAMVEVGEQGGRIEEALRGAANYYKRDWELRHLLTRELAYPIVLLLAIIFIPAIAQFIIVWLKSTLTAAIGAALVRGLLTLVSVGVPAAIVYLTIRTVSRTETGRQRIDAIKLRIPVVGGVVRRVVMARFCRALASLHSAGVLMGTSLRLAAAAAGNALIRSEMERAARKVEQGERLSVALGEAPQVPRTVIRMLSTGEDSGEVDRMAENVAEHYEMEAETAIKQMAVSITPAAILIAAVIIGVMFIGGFMDLYSGF